MRNAMCTAQTKTPESEKWHSRLLVFINFPSPHHPSRARPVSDSILLVRGGGCVTDLYSFISFSRISFRDRSTSSCHDFRSALKDDEDDDDETEEDEDDEA